MENRCIDECSFTGVYKHYVESSKKDGYVDATCSICGQNIKVTVTRKIASDGK